ncbi:TetR/AcrR family transcriptional regulator [Frateuria aurantia]
MSDTKNRRRGPALEAAILDAAWQELLELGYPAMTLESVANRAQTSRPVLHRRWPTKVKLTSAAMARYMSLHPVIVRDSGNAGEELCQLLRGIADRARPDMMRVLFDMSSDLAAADSSFDELRREFATGELMRGILQRAVDRGEMDPERLTPRIIALPTDLARHEMLITLKPLPDQTIREIVMDIFLPLVRPTQLHD